MTFDKIHLLQVLLRLWRFLRRVLRTFVACLNHLTGLVRNIGWLNAHLYTIIASALSWDSLISCWINYLREVPFSSNFLRGRLIILLRRSLLVYLLLLHRIVLRTVINRQLVQTASRNAILIRAYGLIVRIRIRLLVLTHDTLNLSLIIKTCHLNCRLVIILGPQAVNRTLSSSLLAFGVLSTFPILLHGSHFDGI